MKKIRPVNTRTLDEVLSELKAAEKEFAEKCLKYCVSEIEIAEIKKQTKRKTIEE